MTFACCIVYSQSLQIPDSLLKKPIVKIDSTEFTVADYVWYYSKYARIVQDNSELYDTTISLFDTYLDEFIVYKMKVLEAEGLQLDTTRAFRDEFFKYVKQTAHNFMYKGAEQEKENFVKKEYDRLHWDYEVAHIFIKSNVYSSPKDTLEAFNKTKKVLSEIASGKSFEQCVQEYSDDNLTKDLGGNVGFVTAMVSPYEYEEALYKSKVGDIVTARTSEGWYILNVLQKRETKGAVDAAIIMIYPQSEDSLGWNTAKLTIDTVYEQLQAGVPFDTLNLKYNLNEQLREQNGLLGLVDNGMPYSREIKETLFSLQNDGDYSKPIKLPYGYAIVKRRWLLPLLSFDAYETAYEKRIQADKSRASVVDNIYINKMKQSLGYKEYRSELETCLKYVDASILLGKWTAPDLNTDAVLFEIAGEKYSRNDFFQYLQVVQKNRIRDVHDKDMLVRIRYDEYVTRRLEFASMKDLEKNDKDFQYTMQEYHDGMIVYELVNQEVYQEAARDTIGQRFFYNQHPDFYKTLRRCEEVQFSCANEKVKQKAIKLLNSQIAWYHGNEAVKDAARIEYYENKGTPQLYVINSLNTKKGEVISVDMGDAILRQPIDIVDDSVQPEIRLTVGNTIDMLYYCIQSRRQNLNEVKNEVLNDYQKDLEMQWLKSMKKRHIVEKDREVANQVKHIIE